MDLPAIIDEIALEGLEGITVTALWKRLDKRPGFSSFPLDEESKQFIWKSLCTVSEVQFFQLREARPELVVANLFDLRDQSANRLQIPASIQKDFYSYQSVEHPELKGCCSDLEERIDVSEDVRNDSGEPLIPLEEAGTRWGQRLVLVASQRLRNVALMGTNFSTSAFSSFAYGVLERIGRARYDGELAYTSFGRGLASDNKKKSLTSNIVKTLSMHGFVRKQSMVLKHGQNSTQLTNLVHLSRFFQPFGLSLKELRVRLSTYLLHKPNHMEALNKVQQDLGIQRSYWKKVRNALLSELGVCEHAPFRLLHPEATDKQCFHKNGTDKSVKVVRLMDGYVANIGETEDAEDINLDADEENDEPEDLEENEVFHEMKDSKFVLDTLNYSRSILSQVKRHVEESGLEGISRAKLLLSTTLDWVTLNWYVKSMLKMGEIKQVMKMFGRNNTAVYVSPENAEKLKAIEEKQTVQNLSNSKEGWDTPIKQDEDTEMETNDSKLHCSQISPVDLSTRLEEVGLSWTLEVIKPEDRISTSTKLSDKKNARRKYILDQLSQRKVFPTVQLCKTDILTREQQLGMKEIMCNKSFKRILTDLHQEGLINFLHVFSIAEPGNKVKMILEPDMDLNDPRVQKAFMYVHTHILSERIKTEKKSSLKDKSLAMDHEESTSNGQVTTHSSDTSSGHEKKKILHGRAEMTSVCDLLDNPQKDQNSEPIKPVKIGHSQYESGPKFSRAQLLHEYMYYLLYDYRGDKTQSEIKREEDDEPVVYLDTNDWKRFLPPLKKHNSQIFKDLQRPGICMLGDLVVHMPLCVFCHVVQISWEIKGLQQMLDDPIRRNYPLVHMPKPILKLLVYKRKYVFKIQETWWTLCYMGLLSFSKDINQRALEFSTAYLHRHATLLDTQSSLKGYCRTTCPEGDRFPKLRFHFTCLEEVTCYWQTLKSISVNSNLGFISSQESSESYGEVSLLDQSKYCLVKEEEEFDWLPGDRRGAAGLDSSLYLHAWRNWDNQKFSSTNQSKTSITRGMKRKASCSGLVNAKGKESHKKVSKVLPKTTFNRTGLSHYRKIVNAKRSYTKKKPCMQRKGLDDIDRKAKTMMVKLRSSFTSLENGMLLICHVASKLLAPNVTTMVVPFVNIRDIIKEELPEETRDKTTQAFKGKSLRLLKDDNFIMHLAYYLALANSDKELMTKYGRNQHKGHVTVTLFKNLVHDLVVKFRSPRSSQSMEIPSSISELHDNYNICRTMELCTVTLKKQPRQVWLGLEEDVRISVVQELLLSIMHHSSIVNNMEVYKYLEQFDDKHINKAFTNLRESRIINQTKVNQRRSHTELSRTFVLMRNHHLSQSHIYALKPPFPLKLFPVIYAIMDRLERALSERENLLLNNQDAHDVSQESSKESNASCPGHVAIMLNVDSTDNQTSGSSHEEARTRSDSFLGNQTEREPIQVDELDPDVVKKPSPASREVIEVESDSCADVQISAGGSKGSSTGRATLIRETEGSLNFWFVKDEAEMFLQPQTSLGRSDSDTAKEELPRKTVGDKEKKGFLECNMQAVEGGAALLMVTLMSLDLLEMKVDIPDEMVRLTPEGMQKLRLSSPSTAVMQRKRKPEEDNEFVGDEDEETERQSDHPPPSKKHKNSPADEANPVQLHKFKKGKFGDIKPRQGRQQHRCQLGQHLEVSYRSLDSLTNPMLSNMLVWAASGSLILLARMSALNSADMLSSGKSQLHHFISINPLGIRVCLLRKEKIEGPAGVGLEDGTEMKEGRLEKEVVERQGEKTASNSAVIASLVQSGLSSSSSSMEDYRSLTVASRDSALIETVKELQNGCSESQSCADTNTSGVREEKRHVLITNTVGEMDDVDSITTAANPSRGSMTDAEGAMIADSEASKQFLGKGSSSFLSLLNQPQVYEAVVRHLEVFFTSDELKQVSWEEFEPLFDPEQKVIGQKLFNVIDSCGEDGLSEMELEVKLNIPFLRLQQALDMLCQASAEKQASKPNGCL